jgi:hypothetical protein
MMPKIAIKIPSGYAEIERVYGKFEWDDLDNDLGAAITIDPEWIRAHIVALKPSELPDGVLPRPVYLHRLVKEPLRAALIAATVAKPGYRILRSASFVPRHKSHRRDKPLSLHSWGIAWDLNSRTNRYGASLPLPPDMISHPAASIDTERYYDVPAEFVSAFEREGWEWGGHWKTPDAMHFQLATGA